jgi:ADP-ribosyl-[dinitrogen reductase] hydrolase
MTHLTTAQLHRAAGALLGAAAGDALGAGYEFESNPPRHAEMIGGGPFHFAPGEWTDDTQMSICVAEVAATGNLDPAAVGDRFLEWYRGRPRDVGNQTGAVLERARQGSDCAGVAAEYFRRNPHNAAGNGSLMRTAPVALAHLGDTAATVASARAISELTHADPQAGDACVLWCAAIGHAVMQGGLQGAPDPHELLPEGRAGRWAGRLQEAETAPRRTFSHNGYVVTAHQAAQAAVHQTSVPEAMPCLHLQDALRAAVHIGHDTDTVAAIAGALLGARWGVSAIPFAWRRMLHGWPGYGPKDLVRLALLTARGGQVDAGTGWPEADSLLPYYVKNYSLSRRVVALPDDPGVLVGDVAALPDVVGKVDVVISLCRVGNTDVPRGLEHHELWFLDREAPGGPTRTWTSSSRTRPPGSPPAGTKASGCSCTASMRRRARRRSLPPTSPTASA